MAYIRMCWCNTKIVVSDKKRIVVYYWLQPNTALYMVEITVLLAV